MISPLGGPQDTDTPDRFRGGFQGHGQAFLRYACCDRGRMQPAPGSDPGACAIHGRGSLEILRAAAIGAHQVVAVGQVVTVVAEYLGGEQVDFAPLVEPGDHGGGDPVIRGPAVAGFGVVGFEGVPHFRSPFSAGPSRLDEFFISHILRHANVFVEFFSIPVGSCQPPLTGSNLHNHDRAIF